MTVTLTLPARLPVNGQILAAELTAAGIDVSEDDVVLTSPEESQPTLTIVAPDDTAEEQLWTILDAHDPEAISADRWTLPADGATAVTVRWQRRGAAGADVAYDVNGATGTATADADGIIELAVTATNPGPVVVQVGSLEVTLTAEEV